MYIHKQVSDLVPQGVIDEVTRLYEESYRTEDFIQLAAAAYDYDYRDEDYIILYAHEMLYLRRGKLDIFIVGIAHSEKQSIATGFSFSDLSKLLCTDYTLEQLRKCMNIKEI